MQAPRPSFRGGHCVTLSSADPSEELWRVRAGDGLVGWFQRGPEPVASYNAGMHETYIRHWFKTLGVGKELARGYFCTVTPP